MKLNLIALLSLIALTSFKQIGATELNVIAVGEASIEKQQVIFDYPDKVKGKLSPKLTNLLSVMSNNFSFYKKYFSVVKRFESFKSNIGELALKNIKGKSFLIKSEVVGQSLKMELFDPAKAEVKYSVLITQDEIVSRKRINEISNEIYRQITGKDSIFNSFIVFVSDKDGTRRKPVKELYRSNFDGSGLERLTYHRETVISPSISQDKKKVVYSLIRMKNNKRNVDLYLMDLETKKLKLVSTFPGINSGAVFLPDGQSILLTLTYTGNAEIFEINLNTKKKRKVTKHWADEVDPSINHTGDLMTFLSSRPGRAMIYTADPRGTERNVKRIGFVGRFNATPRFSPDGKKIAFSSWVDNRFDLYQLNADGSGLIRLTKDFGSNESPTYSQDNEFIAFSSQRVLSRTKAVQNIYIMTDEGEIFGAITDKMGNCSSPRWSK